MSGNQDFLRAPVYRFFVSPDSKFNDQQSLQLVNLLLSLKKVAFQILARPGAIVWEAVDLSGNTKHLLSGFYDVQVEYDFWEGHWRKVYPCYRYVASYGLKLFDDKPITYITDLYQDADPLVPVAQVMSNLLDFEEVRFTLYVGRTHRRGSLMDMIYFLGFLSGEQTPRRYYQTDRDRLVKHKASQEQYRTWIGVEITSPDINRVKYLSQAITSVLNNFDRSTPNHPSNGLRALYSWDTQPIIQMSNFEEDEASNMLVTCELSLKEKAEAKLIESVSVNLTAAEIAALWHLPHQAFQQTQVFWAKKVVQVPDLIEREYIRGNAFPSV
jgi:hypothetical protein